MRGTTDSRCRTGSNSECIPHLLRVEPKIRIPEEHGLTDAGRSGVKSIRVPSAGDKRPLAIIKRKRDIIIHTFVSFCASE